MIEQFRQAMAANPDCIVIMGHPGSAAFEDLVEEATAKGIIVTHGNAPLSEGDEIVFLQAVSGG